MENKNFMHIAHGIRPMKKEREPAVHVSMTAGSLYFFALWIAFASIFRSSISGRCL